MTTRENYWQRLRSIALIFLRLGVIGFGGPLAHIGLMEDECVTRRQWLTHESFLEGLSICNLLPGPTSTQLSIYLGYIYAGALGGLVSGICFITPAFVLVLILAWAYIQYGTLPAVGALFYGIGPVVVAIILNTLYRSGKTALTKVSSWCIGVVSCLLTLFPLLPPSINLVTILFVSGVVGILLYERRPSDSSPRSSKNEDISQTSSAESKPDQPHHGDRKGRPYYIGALATQAIVLLPYMPPGVSILISLALVFLKIGVLMFGGGLVIAPLLQQELVDGPHWLTTRQLLDGLALGQLTPGPVTTVATFAGYAIGGIAGGIVATIAVFLPSFVLVLGLSPLLMRVRNVPMVKGFLKGITAGALGAIAAAAIFLGRAALVDVVAVAIALVSLLLLVRWNVNTIFLIGSAAVIGLLHMLFL